MDIEVIHHHMNGLGFRVCLRQALHHARELVPGSIWGGGGEMPAGLGLHHAENVGGATPFVFIVLLGGLAWLYRTRCPHVGVQGHWFLIQTNHGFGGIVRLLINAQCVLHAVDVVRVQLRHAPHFFPATASTRGFATKSGWSRARPWGPVYVSQPPRPPTAPSSARDLLVEYCKP